MLTLFSLVRLIILVIFVEVVSLFFVVINADVDIFVQGEVFARVVVHTPVPADGSDIGHAVAKGLIPRGGLVKWLIRVLGGVKGS